MFRLVLVFTVMSFFSSLGFTQEKLIFAIDVVRHGDRTPVIPSPEMDKIWSQGLGQLTPEGMRQEYFLGQALRQEYVAQYQLLPEIYDANTMYVRSSDLPRTLMSAQSILFGLYPLHSGPKALPEDFQPIPIHTVPQEQDNLLVPGHDEEIYKELLQTYIFNSPEWIQKDQMLKPYYQSWQEIFGVKIHNLLDIIKISDRLFIEKIYHISLPQGLSQQEAEMIFSTGKWAWLNLMNHPKFSGLFGHELSETITHEIITATKTDRPLKYLLFVAHDSTIAVQLNLLGQVVDEIPPYASILHYLVFDKGHSQYEVRVIFNKKPLFIKECGGERCALNDFLASFDSI